jgi:TonB family protein
MLTAKTSVRFLLLTVLAGVCIIAVYAEPQRGGYPQPTPTPKNEDPPVDITKLGLFGKIQIDAQTAEEQATKKVDPQYPPTAQAAKIQGDVIIHVLIDKKGHVAKAKTMTGDPALVDAAMTAAKQWQYAPFYQNGKPLEVETNILFKFRPQK